MAVCFSTVTSSWSLTRCDVIANSGQTIAFWNNIGGSDETRGVQTVAALCL